MKNVMKRRIVKVGRVTRLTKAINQVGSAEFGNLDYSYPG